MGREEIDCDRARLAELRAEGLDLRGPLRPTRCSTPPRGRATTPPSCMYHDQALIPIKTLDFAGGVNVTLGLPFVRTSPDHGTAFDIAGTRGMGDGPCPGHGVRPRALPSSRPAPCKGDVAGARAAHPEAGGASWATHRAIDSLPPLREVINAHGLSARKALGQNFLLDLNLTAKIARVPATCRAPATCSRSAPAPAGSRAGCWPRARAACWRSRRTPLPARPEEIAAAYEGRLTVIEGDALDVDPLPVSARRSASPPTCPTTSARSCSCAGSPRRTGRPSGRA